MHDPNNTISTTFYTNISEKVYGYVHSQRFIMPRQIFSRDDITRIRTFLELGWSFSTIRKKLKDEGKLISKAYLSKLKNSEYQREPSMHVRAKRKGKFRKFSHASMSALRHLISQPNPPTQREMAKRFKCSPKAVRNAIKKL